MTTPTSEPTGVAPGELVPELIKAAQRVTDSIGQPARRRLLAGTPWCRLDRGPALRLIDAVAEYDAAVSAEIAGATS
jgi:hypothetical protein